MDKNKSLIPWYINDTLSESERRSVEIWIEGDSNADDDFQSTQLISQVIRTQDSHAPSIQIKTKLLSRIQQQPVRLKNRINPWIWGGPVMLVIFILLWLIVQPGTLLQWSINGNTPATFLIYRAPVGSSQFVLIDELSAKPTQPTYQYADMLVFPGQSYQYLIEIRDQYGNTTSSHAAMSDSQMTFAAQFALLLTSFILTLGIVTATQEINSFPRIYLSV